MLFSLTNIIKLTKNTNTISTTITNLTLQVFQLKKGQNVESSGAYLDNHLLNHRTPQQEQYQLLNQDQGHYMRN